MSYSHEDEMGLISDSKKNYAFIYSFYFSDKTYLFQATVSNTSSVHYNEYRIFLLKKLYIEYKIMNEISIQYVL